MRTSKAIGPADVARVAAGFRAAIPPITVRVAREQLAFAEAVGPAPYRQYVDGREGASLESVVPGGNILFRFARIGFILDWIYAQIYRISPVRTGAYRADHQLYVNGARVTPETAATLNIPPGAECWLINTKPYARRLEHGWSTQAPDGVYEITAVAAKARFPATDITFVYTEMGSIGPVIHGAFSHRRGAHASYAYPTIIVRSPP